MFDPTEINENAFRYYTRLRMVQRFVLEHRSEKISAETAAKVAGLEKNYFSSYFRKKTGVTFGEWQAWVRIDKAKDLMSTTDDSISEVAEAVGYLDLRTFQRAFKRCTAKTPREFKKTVCDSLAGQTSKTAT
jgi:two-component system response regulator YesN